MRQFYFDPKDGKELKKTPLFKGLSLKEIEILLRDSSTKVNTYLDQEVVVDKGDKAHDLYYVASGKIQVYGDNGLPLRVIGTHEFFGVSNLFHQKTFLTKLVSVGKTRVIVFSQKKIESLLKKNEGFMKSYILFLEDRIYFLNQKISLLSEPSTSSSLWGYLEAYSKAHGKTFVLEMSYQKLAKTLNISRASLYRALSDLEEEKLIIRDGKTITVKVP